MRMEGAREMGKQYGFNDPQIEETASQYTQGRLAGAYYEARFQGEQRAVRGHTSAAYWAAGIYCPLLVAAVLTAVSGGILVALTPFGLGAFLGSLIAGVGLGHAQQEEKLCGLRPAGYDLLWVECYVIGFPSLLVFTAGIVGHMAGLF